MAIPFDCHVEDLPVRRAHIPAFFPQLQAVNRPSPGFPGFEERGALLRLAFHEGRKHDRRGALAGPLKNRDEIWLEVAASFAMIAGLPARALALGSEVAAAIVRKYSQVVFPFRPAS
jgi:hypothetical protein